MYNGWRWYDFFICSISWPLLINEQVWPWAFVPFEIMKSWKKENWITGNKKQLLGWRTANCNARKGRLCDGVITFSTPSTLLLHEGG